MNFHVTRTCQLKKNPKTLTQCLKVPKKEKITIQQNVFVHKLGPKPNINKNVSFKNQLNFTLPSRQIRALYPQPIRDEYVRQPFLVRWFFPVHPKHVQTRILHIDFRSLHHDPNPKYYHHCKKEKLWEVTRIRQVSISIVSLYWHRSPSWCRHRGFHFDNTATKRV